MLPAAPGRPDLRALRVPGPALLTDSEASRPAIQAAAPLLASRTAAVAVHYTWSALRRAASWRKRPRASTVRRTASRCSFPAVGENSLTDAAAGSIVQRMMAALQRWLGMFTVALLAGSALSEPAIAADRPAASLPDSSLHSAASAFSTPARDWNAGDGLEATTSAAWVPPHPVSAEEPWERVLRLPERIAFFPLSVLGLAAKNTARYAEERQFITRFSGPAAGTNRPRFGLSVGAPHLGPGVGLGLAVDFKPSVLGNLFSAELAGSTRRYTRTRLALDRGPATLHYEYDWRPRDAFFGYGLGSSGDSMSSYAWRQQRFQLTLAYPWGWKDKHPPKLQISGWAGPREITIRRGRRAPSFEQEFPSQSGLLNLRQEHFVYGMRLAGDTRSGVPHWGRGFLAEARIERFDKPIDGLTIRSANTVEPQFTRLSLKGEAAVSFMPDPRTIRITVRSVSTGSVTGSAPLLIPDLASLGADDGLASLQLGRYRDRDALYGAVAYIFSMSAPLEMEFHAETGGVYARMTDARVATLKQSFGFSLRPRTDVMLLAAVGADWSPGVFVIRYSLWGAE